MRAGFEMFINNNRDEHQTHLPARGTRKEAAPRNIQQEPCSRAVLAEHEDPEGPPKGAHTA